ncbi:DUF968 domain-containing protein [Psychrobacter vallis]|uniref:DUF968 domain-containing protein n=1 Tax=Psychrobacter vallis TaxID=248451 RepID=UPI001917C74D|nr:hypothetical protein [Psychrobacter vallis]
MDKRDSKRLDQIRSLPCCHCGASPRSQAAHSNFSEHGKGRGIKSDDAYTIPLCANCHGKLDQYNMGMTRQQSLDWFNDKLNFINEVLDDQAKGETSIF